MIVSSTKRKNDKDKICVSKIELGSLVRLRSGGPVMTVDMILDPKEGCDSTWIIAKWFDANLNLFWGCFGVHSLRIINLPEED